MSNDNNYDNYNDNNNDNLTIIIPTALDPLYASVEVVSCLLSVLENSLVVVLFVKDRSLRSVKNYYVISLATADLLVGLLGVPSALSVSVGLPRNFHACLLMTSLLLLLCTGSIMSLVAVTVDRFWAIVLPLAYPSIMTPTRARTFIVIAWLIATVVGLLPTLGWNRGQPPEPRCFFTEVTHPGYLVFIYFGTIVAPSIFMALIYIFIYRTVKLEGRKLSRLLSDTNGVQLHDNQHQQQLLQQRQLATEAAAAKSIAIVVVVFLVSWIPLYTVNTVNYFCPSFVVSDWLLKLTIILSHLNSVWNPILYAWGMNDFRASLKKFCPLSTERNHLLKK